MPHWSKSQQGEAAVTLMLVSVRQQLVGLLSFLYNSYFCASAIPLHLLLFNSVPVKTSNDLAQVPQWLVFVSDLPVPCFCCSFLWKQLCALLFNHWSSYTFLQRRIPRSLIMAVILYTNSFHPRFQTVLQAEYICQCFWSCGNQSKWFYLRLSSGCRNTALGSWGFACMCSCVTSWIWKNQSSWVACDMCVCLFNLCSRLASLLKEGERRSLKKGLEKKAVFDLSGLCSWQTSPCWNRKFALTWTCVVNS